MLKDGWEAHYIQSFHSSLSYYSLAHFNREQLIKLVVLGPSTLRQHSYLVLLNYCLGPRLLTT